MLVKLFPRDRSSKKNSLSTSAGILALNMIRGHDYRHLCNGHLYFWRDGVYIAKIMAFHRNSIFTRKWNAISIFASFPICGDNCMRNLGCWSLQLYQFECLYSHMSHQWNNFMAILTGGFLTQNNILNTASFIYNRQYIITVKSLI